MTMLGMVKLVIDSCPDYAFNVFDVVSKI